MTHEKVGRSGVVRLFLIVLLCSCAARVPGAENTVVAFGVALEKGDAVAAYGLMSQAYRDRVTFEAFRQRFEADSELGRRFQQIDRSRGRQVTLRTESMPAVELTFDSGGYRLDDLPEGAVDQSSPRASLQSLLKAVERRRYDRVLRLAPLRFRKSLDADMIRRFWESSDGSLKPERAAELKTLRLASEGRIIEEGDEALLHFGQGREVRFEREEGRWFVVEIP